jgi:hypothetical protein
MLRFSNKGGDKDMEEIMIPAAIAALSAIYYGMNPLLK